jgi:phosphoserine aminotransferase
LKYDRKFNFSAGPSALPIEVLEECREEIFNYKGFGMSVMEMSHRSDVFLGIMDDTQALLREVMEIPENYKVLFLQGGASLQFSMIPMNLSKNGKADYIISGHFSNLAAKEAEKFINVQVVANSKDTNYDRIPSQSELTLDSNADYVHICYNNTVAGSMYPYIPDTADVPLVADMSSCILSEPIDVSRFGVIYAGAQKNMAPSGLTAVIIRNDLIKEPPQNTPALLNYKLLAENDSKYNTPPCWCIYMLKLSLEHIKATGGLVEMQKHNIKKAKQLYDFLDSSKLFKAHVQPKDRSLMNVTFRTNSNEMDAKFFKEAEMSGFSNLKGHPAVGGLRASIYNAMPIEGTAELAKYMAEFEKANTLNT